MILNALIHVIVVNVECEMILHIGQVPMLVVYLVVQFHKKNDPKSNVGKCLGCNQFGSTFYGYMYEVLTLEVSASTSTNTKYLSHHCTHY